MGHPCKLLNMFLIFLVSSSVSGHPVIDGEYHVHEPPSPFDSNITTVPHDFEWNVIPKIQVDPNGGQLEIFELTLGKDIKTVVIGKSGRENSLRVLGVVEAKDGIILQDGLLIKSRGDLIGPKGRDGLDGRRGPTGNDGRRGPAGPAAHTVAVCLENQGSTAPNCSCSGVEIFRENVPSLPGGSCTVTADTGTCSASGHLVAGSSQSGCCAVCAAN